MEDSIRSQADSENSQKCPVGRDKSKRMKKRSGFKPPVKEKCTVSTTSSATYRIHTAISNSSQKHNTDQTKVCHTVLSYCDNDRTDDHGPFDMDTQPLSMFSGETEGEEAIGDLDGLLFQLDDPFSKSNDTQSSECSKLDDPLFKLDDPFSLSSDSLRIAQEKMIEFGSFDEQIVPASPQCKHSQADSEHETEVRVGSVETVPRRQFKVPQSRRCYNLDLLPKHYKKGIRKNRDDVRARSRPGVNSNVSVLVRNAEKEGMGGGGGGDRPMSVYEVPLSAGDHRERGKESRELRNAGRQSRANVSMSKLDLSLHSRTREEQLSIDLEVLEAISRTREEIRALRTKYAMMTSGDVSILPHSTHHHSYHPHRHLHKPKLHVQVVRGDPRKHQ